MSGPINPSESFTVWSYSSGENYFGNIPFQMKFNRLNGFIRIDEAGLYTFQGVGDDCTSGYLFNPIQSNNLYATNNWNHELASESIRLEKGYYPIYYMSWLGDYTNSFEAKWSRDGGAVSHIPRENTVHNNDAVLIQDLYYTDRWEFTSTGEQSIFLSSCLGYSRSFTVSSALSGFTIGQNTGKLTGSFSSCNSKSLIVVTASTGTSKSSTAFTATCNPPARNEILVNYYVSQNVSVTSYVDPSTALGYMLRFRRYESDFTLRISELDSSIEDNFVVEWKGQINIRQVTCSLKLDCSGSCYMSIGDRIVNKFGSSAGESSFLTWDGVYDLHIVYYFKEGTPSISLQYASTVGGSYADLSDSFEFYREAKDASIIPSFIYADFPSAKSGISISLELDGISSSQITSYSISPSLPSGLTMSNSPSNFISGSTPLTDLAVREYTITADISGYKLTTTIYLGVTLIRTQQSINYPTDAVFSGELGSEVNISPENYNGECESLYLASSAPAGVRFNTKTGVFSGHLMSVISHTVDVVCVSGKFEVLTSIATSILPCNTGSEIVHVSITLGPDPALFTTALINYGNGETIFLRHEDETPYLPYETLETFQCMSQTVILSVNSQEAIKGTYYIERANASFVSAGEYSSTPSIDLTSTGAPTPSYSSSNLIFYVGIRGAYYLNVAGLGSVSFSVSPSFRITGLSMDEYGTISGISDTVVEARQYRITTRDANGATASVTVTVSVRSCDLASVNIYFPYLSTTSGSNSTRNNGGFRFRSSTNIYYFYQDGAQSSRSSYQLCLSRGTYQLILTSSDGEAWKDNYIKLYVNGVEEFNAIHTGGDDYTYTVSLNTYINNMEPLTLTYTDFLTDNQTWKSAGINSGNCINFYTGESGSLYNQYTVARYYTYQVSLSSSGSVRPVLYRAVIHYESGIIISINGFEIYRKYVPGGELNPSDTAINPVSSTVQIDIPLSLFRTTSTNYVAIESHLASKPATESDAVDKFKIESFTPVYAEDNCYNFIFTSSQYSSLSSSADPASGYRVDSIFDGAKATNFYTESATEGVSVNMRLSNYLMSYNAYILRTATTGITDAPTSISSTGILGSSTYTLIKEKQIDFSESADIRSLGSEVGVPVEEFTVRFGSGANMRLADFIPRYCLQYCSQTTETIGGRIYTWPATTYGDTAEISCGVGYDGHLTRECSASGTWGSSSNECTVTNIPPEATYSESVYNFVRGEVSSTGAPVITGAENVAFTISPELSAKYPGLSLDSATGQISGIIDVDGTAGGEHSLTETYTITCTNPENSLYTTNTITINAEDPKCDETYLGESLDGECREYTTGSSKIPCELINNVPQFGEEDYSTCTYRAITTGDISTAYISTIFFYDNTIKYHPLWSIGITSCPYECFSDRDASSTIDCPEWFNVSSSCVVTGLKPETLTTFYFRCTPANPATPAGLQSGVMAVQRADTPSYSAVGLTYAQELYTFEPTATTNIRPVDSIQIDHCSSSPELPQGFTLSTNYYLDPGVIYVNRPQEAVNQTFTITCGNRVDNTSATFRIVVELPHCNDPTYGIASPGQTKYISCDEGELGLKWALCSESLTYTNQGENCTAAKPKVFRYQTTPIQIYTGVQPTTVTIVHDADIGVGIFTANCNLVNGLSINRYTGQLYGAATQTTSNIQRCVVSLTQDITINSTLSYIVSQGSCNYQGNSIPLGSTQTFDCGEGYSGTVTVVCPSNSNTPRITRDCTLLTPSFFFYGVSSLSIKLGSDMTPLTPISDASSSATYSVSPALPNGLSVNETTGVISGNPTVVSGATEYTITCVDGTTRSYKMTIRIVDKTCPAADSFPETPIESYGERRCVNGADGYERRYCNEDQTWSDDIDDFQCQDVDPELSYPTTEYTFFVGVEIEEINYEVSIGILTYTCDTLPSGIYIDPNTGRIYGTPEVAASSARYEISGYTSSSEIIRAYVTFSVVGTYCSSDSGFPDTQPGYYSIITCSGAMWGVQQRFCNDPSEDIQNAYWGDPTNCNRTVASTKTKYMFDFTLHPSTYANIFYEDFYVVYKEIYNQLSGVIPDDIDSLTFTVSYTNRNVTFTFKVDSDQTMEDLDIVIQQMLHDNSGTVLYNINNEIGMTSPFSSSEVTVSNVQLAPVDVEEDDSGVDLGLIIGIVVGCVALILIIAIICVCCRMRSKKSSSFEADTKKSKKAARA